MERVRRALGLLPTAQPATQPAADAGAAAAVATGTADNGNGGATAQLAAPDFATWFAELRGRSATRVKSEIGPVVSFLVFVLQMAALVLMFQIHVDSGEYCDAEYGDLMKKEVVVLPQTNETSKFCLPQQVGKDCRADRKCAWDEETCSCNTTARAVLIMACMMVAFSFAGWALRALLGALQLLETADPEWTNNQTYYDEEGGEHLKEDPLMQLMDCWLVHMWRIVRPEIWQRFLDTRYWNPELVRAPGSRFYPLTSGGSFLFETSWIIVAASVNRDWPLLSVSVPLVALHILWIWLEVERGHMVARARAVKSLYEPVVEAVVPTTRRQLALAEGTAVGHVTHRAEAEFAPADAAVGGGGGGGTGDIELQLRGPPQQARRLGGGATSGSELVPVGAASAGALSLAGVAVQPAAGGVAGAHKVVPMAAAASAAAAVSVGAPGFREGTRQVGDNDDASGVAYATYAGSDDADSVSSGEDEGDIEADAAPVTAVATEQAPPPPHWVAYAQWLDAMREQSKVHDVVGPFLSTATFVLTMICAWWAVTINLEEEDRCSDLYPIDFATVEVAPSITEKVCLPENVTDACSASHSCRVNTVDCDCTANNAIFYTLLVVSFSIQSVGVLFGLVLLLIRLFALHADDSSDSDLKLLMDNWDDVGTYVLYFWPAKVRETRDFYYSPEADHTGEGESLFPAFGYVVGSMCMFATAAVFVDALDGGVIFMVLATALLVANMLWAAEQVRRGLARGALATRCQAYVDQEAQAQRRRRERRDAERDAQRCDRAVRRETERQQRRERRRENAMREYLTARGEIGLDAGRGGGKPKRNESKL